MSLQRRRGRYCMGTSRRWRRCRPSSTWRRCWAPLRPRLVVASIISRVVRPSSPAVQPQLVAEHHPGRRPRGGRRIHRRDLRRDGLAHRAGQRGIEKKLAAKHLVDSVNPGPMVLFDLTSAWVTGRCCELAARGYSRDGKEGLRADRIRRAHRPLMVPRSRCGCSRATPTTRPRSPRSACM